MKKSLLVFLLVLGFRANSQIISTVVGSGSAGFMTGGYSGDGGPADSAEMKTPTGIVFDTLGNMYISDLGNNCIRKIDTLGIITTICGTGILGDSGDGGPASAAQLNAPWGITIDTYGNLYIADWLNNRVRMINTAGIITTVVGRGGQGSGGDGGPAADADLFRPSDLTFDIHGNLYIADSYNNVIRKVDTMGIISTIAGSGTQGYSGDGGQALSAQLSLPFGVAVDSVGNLYIADSGNNRVRKVDTSGVITTVAGDGTGGYFGDGGPASVSEVFKPMGVTLDKKGNLYIADYNNYRVRKIDAAGIIITVVGNGLNAGLGPGGFNGDGGYADSAEIYNPTRIAFDNKSNMYVVDEFNNRIRKIDTCHITSASFTMSQTQPFTWDAFPVYSNNVIKAVWNWGDSTYTTGMYPSHVYDSAGIYNICVTVYSICGDSTTYCQSDSLYRSSPMIYINVQGNSMSVNHSTQRQLKVYPNPANNIITVQANEKLGMILLYNSIGEMTFKMNSDNFKTDIDISTLPKGIYTFKVRDIYTRFVKE